MTTRYLSNITLSLLALTLFSGSLLISSSTFADDSSVDNIAISIPVSCTLSGTGMNSHNAAIPNGTYQDNIGTTTLKAFCNDTNGFAIYANGYTGDTLGNNKLIGSSTSSEIVTGTATTAGSPDVSNWAVKLATDSTATYPITLDNSFGAYSSVPSTYTKVAHRDSGTDLGSSATGASLTTTYAVYISKTQQADTYDGKVKYTLVHPASADPGQHEIECEAGKICYNANSSNVVGEMGKQSASNNASVTLWASNFSRSGYGFAGWNTAYDYSGTTYGPNETITTPADTSTNGLSLYAVWIPSAGTLQNWSGCSGLAQGSVTALTDSRDNNAYAVAKLADGKCWMIENLRLENTASHNSDGSMAQGYNSSFIGLAASETANFSNSTTANSLYSTDGTTDATILGVSQGYRFPRYNNFNTQSRQSGSSYSTDNNTYSYGNYYTWHAAIADTTYYNTNNQSITSSSLCPAGWHLPKGGDSSNTTNSEFWQLGLAIMDNVVPDEDLSDMPHYSDIPTNNAGDNATKAFRKYPNNFVLSGQLYTSTVYGRGIAGTYWLSTVNNNIKSYDFLLNTTSTYPGTDYFTKYSGYAIRCTQGS